LRKHAELRDLTSNIARTSWRGRARIGSTHLTPKALGLQAKPGLLTRRTFRDKFRALPRCRGRPTYP
jgi:hypothetical protein